MSYARFAHDSDAYVFRHVDGHLLCCSCEIEPSGKYETRRTGDMIVHLGKHRQAGHLVPTSTIDALNAEWDANDALMAARA